MSPRWIALFALQCSIAACGSGGDAVCVHDTDCPSGFCKADGTCGDACTTSTECVTGFTCDPSSRQCVAPVTDGGGGESGGCAMSEGHDGAGSRTTTAWWLLGALGVIGAGRRRIAGGIEHEERR